MMVLKNNLLLVARSKRDDTQLFLTQFFCDLVEEAVFYVMHELHLISIEQSTYGF